MMVQDSEIVRWSSVLQHVLVFIDYRKMVLVHLYHCHIDTNFIVQKHFPFLPQTIIYTFSGNKNILCLDVYAELKRPLASKEKNSYTKMKRKMTAKKTCIPSSFIIDINFRLLVDAVNRSTEIDGIFI